MFRGGLEPWHIIIILLLALLLFGGFKKLPDASRSIGRSLRILKAETKGLRDEDGKGGKSDPSTASADIPKPLPEGRTAQGGVTQGGVTQGGVSEPRNVPTPIPTTGPDPQRDQR